MRAFRGIALASTFGIALYALVAFGALALIAPPSAQHEAHAQACPMVGWHQPTDHEHGDAPPQWVTDSAWQPFTQCRENHRGYKGALSTGTNGVEAYLIGHIFSTAGARSHGDHDYQLWLREPTGVVSHWDGILNFGVPTAPHDCSKSANRPSMQEVPSNEAWYTGADQAPQALTSVGWLMQGPNEPFCTGVTAGDGSERNMAWTVKAENFPGPYAQYVSPTLANFCVVEPGKGCLLKFGRSADFAAGTMTVPN